MIFIKRLGPEKFMQSPQFNYSFDVRGKPLQQARHWSAPEIFGSRAKFNANVDPATLDIEVEALNWISFRVKY